MKLLVNTCTVGVPFVQEIERAMAARGVTVVDCPISGGPPGARAGTLSVMVSGDPAAVERIRPMISLWGRTLTVAGDKPGAAQVLKLTNNILSAVALAATAEAFVMGAKGGLDPEVMLAAINAGSGRNSATGDKFPRAVLTRSFDYGAEMHILMKDIDLAVAQGEELGVPMWVCEAARLVFKHAMHKGAATEDLTAIVKYIERDAGFEMPKTPWGRTPREAACQPEQRLRCLQMGKIPGVFHHREPRARHVRAANCGRGRSWSAAGVRRRPRQTSYFRWAKRWVFRRLIDLIRGIKGNLTQGGGWGGIRTHEELAPPPVFKTGALNRSATHPSCRFRWRWSVVCSARYSRY